MALFQMPGTVSWYPQCLALITLGFLIASACVYKVNKPLAFISVYAIYSWLFICHQHPRALMLLVLCFAGIGLTALVSKIEETHKMYICLIVMAILQFALLLFQKAGFDPFFYSLVRGSGHTELVGFVGSHNQLGIYYAAMAPILFHLCMPLMLISFVAIIFSTSSSAAIGAAIGIFAYIVLIRARYLLFVFIPVCLVCLIMLQRFDSTIDVASRRAELWKQTIEQLSVGKVNMDMGKGVHHIQVFSPWTGAGIGNFMTLSPLSQGERLFGKGWQYDNTPRWEHAHNDLVEYIFDFGWLGIPLLAWLLFDIISKFIAAVKTNMLVVTFSSLIAQAVTSMGVYIIHAPVSYFMLCLTLGIFYAECNRSRKLCVKEI